MRYEILAFATVTLLALAAATGTAAADTTTIEVQLNEDGDATWTVTTETPLESEDEVEGFQNIVDDQERQTNLAEDTRDRFSAFADRASSDVDRDMSVSDASAEASIEDDVGITVVEFDWDRFASEEDGSVNVGDVFAGGFSFDEGTSMTVHAPEGYEVADADAPEAEADDTSVTWTGPVEFEGDVSVAFEPAEGDGGEGLPGFTALVALVALLAVAGFRQLE